MRTPSSFSSKGAGLLARSLVLASLLGGASAGCTAAGVGFSQIHAVQLADMNGDGLPGIVTGKRRWAHGPTTDEEPMADPVLFWFELRRYGRGGGTFVRHLIDSDSGVGTQFFTGQANADGKLDIVTANRHGVFVFTQK